MMANYFWRTSKSFLLLRLVLVAVGLASAEPVGNESSTTHYQKSGTMDRIFGSQQGANDFIDKVWSAKDAKDWYHFQISSEQIVDYNDLWSLGLAELSMTAKAQLPWMYEKDVKLVKDGETHYTSSRPASWHELLNKGLTEGSSLVMNHVHQRSVPIYTLCADAEERLGVFVSANSYLTPADNTGFYPHYDAHDILVLQLEGLKTWTLCERREVDVYRHKHEPDGKGVFPDYDSSSNNPLCTNITMNPGDVLYAQMGTIHAAHAESMADNDIHNTNVPYSLHLTLSMDRTQFTFGQLIIDLVETRTSQMTPQLSHILSRSPRLSRQLSLPHYIYTLSKSLNNHDLPPDYITQLRTDVQQVLDSEFQPYDAQLHNMLSGLLQQEPRALEETVDLFRQKLIMGRLVPVQPNTSCSSSMAWTRIKKNPSKIAAIQFRRVPHRRILLADLPNGNFLVTGSEASNQQYIPSEWKLGIEYALSTYAGAQGGYFSFQDLRGHAKLTSDISMAMVQRLLTFCVLEFKEGDMLSSQATEAKLLTGNGSCEDLHQDCSWWASWESDECKNNPAYMLQQCRKTCGACPQLNDEL